MNERKSVLLIVADSGFDAASLDGVAPRLDGFYDLVSGRVVEGQPVVDDSDRASFAGDPLNHGSIVLGKLARLVPDASFALVRAITPEDRIVRGVRASDGSLSRNGWTEAVAWAVNLAQRRRMLAVANCSFGGFPDMDTLLFESYQLAQVVGAGKPGRVFVAAAGDPAGHEYLPAPAAFPHVLSVGLRNVRYSAMQGFPGNKPDVLLPGEGPISFRTPEVTAAVARLMLAGYGELDVNGFRSLLGKYPDVDSL